MIYDFSSLSKRQTEILYSIAFGGDNKGFHVKPIKVLLDKGMIVEVERTTHDRLGIFTWIEYEMPIAAHIALCEKLSSDCEENEWTGK